jgi:hypothetical protein
MKNRKPLRIGESMIKCYQRTSDGQQHKGSACIICGKGFDDCEHSFADIDKVVGAIEIALMLGIRVKGQTL